MLERQSIVTTTSTQLLVLRMKINNASKCTLNFKVLYNVTDERLESCFYVTLLNMLRYEYFRN